MKTTIRRKARFSRPYLRTTKEFVVNIPGLPSPTLKYLRVKAPWIRSIGQDTAPTEPVMLSLCALLEKRKSLMSAFEYNLKLKRYQTIVLGYQHALWLVEHQKEFPDFMALLGKFYIDFPGIVVLSKNGFRRSPYLHREFDTWDVRWAWIKLPTTSKGRVAVNQRKKTA